MELTLPIRTLSAALRLVKPTNKFGPQTVQLSADWNGLRLTVASNEATTSYLVPAKVGDSGDVTVGFKDLAGAVKGKGDIALRSLGDSLEAQNGLTSRIPTAGNVTLELPDEPITTWFTLDADAIADVFPAATTDEARPVLCGVYLNGADVVATDSYRLHIARFAAPYGGPSVLLPKPVITVLAKVGGIGRIGFGATTTVVELSGYVCRFRTDDHLNYPKYEQLIPDSTDAGTLTFDPASFSHALAGMKTAAKKASAPVRISAGAPGQVHLTVKMGENTLDTDVPGSLDTETVAFSVEYLSDLVANTSVTEMQVNGLKPAVLRGRGARWEQIRLIMPVRVG